MTTGPPAPSASRVLVAYGTRPEAIKMAPVIWALRDRPDRFEVVVATTAQHREMIDQVEDLLALRPDHDLDLMRPEQELNDLAARAIVGFDDLLRQVRPELLLVQGDTTTAMTGALAAFHRRIAVGHVEAGLRTGDLRHPFPEEANRRVVDVVADALFAPTAAARDALLQEGARADRVHLTGNTVVDALHRMSDQLPVEVAADQVLITIHRRESFGAPLHGILAAIRELASRFPHTRWTYPLHRNPQVRIPARETLGGLANVELLEPLAYDQMVRLLRRVRLVLTDSGGLQEEAPTFAKPVLVLRERTERPEGIAAGVARVVGLDPETIVAETSRLLRDPAAYAAMARAVNPYGDGRAGRRIAAILAGEAYEPFAPGAAPEPGHMPDARG